MQVLAVTAALCPLTFSSNDFEVSKEIIIAASMINRVPSLSHVSAEIVIVGTMWGYLQTTTREVKDSRFYITRNALSDFSGLLYCSVALSVSRLLTF